MPWRAQSSLLYIKEETMYHLQNEKFPTGRTQYQLEGLHEQ